MNRPVNEIANYIDSQDFIDDCAKLSLASGKAAELQRWAISLRWSENLVDMGRFPTDSQSYASARFVLGEISLAKFLAALRI